MMMTILEALLTYLGVSFFWIILNLRSLFQKKELRKHYYLVDLWRGRSEGKKPDGRPYALTGFIVLMVVGALFAYVVF